MKRKDGNVVEEEFRFQNLADFHPKKSYSEIRLFAAVKHGAGAVQQNCSSAKTNKILQYVGKRSDKSCIRGSIERSGTGT
jgi:hypothetical protein